MSFLERLFHAILFETTVVLLSVFRFVFLYRRKCFYSLWVHGIGFLNRHAMESRF